MKDIVLLMKSETLKLDSNDGLVRQHHTTVLFAQHTTCKGGFICRTTRLFPDRVE